MKNIVIVLLILACIGIFAGTVMLINTMMDGTLEQSTGGASIIVHEEFDQAIEAADGKSFGDRGALTFELYRNGTFVVDGQSGFAWQQSDSYLDSAIIRTTDPLPSTYRIRVVVGDIEYDLDNIRGLENDPQYREGPKNENGCYFIAITDEMPNGNYTNDWWHQHRKVVIDVDNNVWGHGMPHPVFMVYFDSYNKLVAYDGDTNEWQDQWERAVNYENNQWYSVELEKTDTHFIFSIADESGTILKRAEAQLSDIWHTDSEYPDYFVIGDPHENYYQGSMKIKSITITQ